MKRSIINAQSLFTSIHRRIAVIALFCYFIIHTSYLLSGCTYTIEGNPDVDLTEIHLSPITAVVANNGRLILTASVLGFSNTASVTWSINGGDAMTNGTITPNGSSAIYLAPVFLHNQIAVITVTSSENPNRSVSDTIFVARTSDTAFSVSPSLDTILTNSTQQFLIDTITFQSAIPPIRWEIVSGSGSISDSGLYTAPSTISSDGAQTVIRAVSLLDSSVFSQSTITLLNASDSLLCYTRDIETLLSANCGVSGCHDAISQKGGYNFTTFGGTTKSVHRGNARASRLYTAITQFNVNSRMPPAPAPAFGPEQVLKLGEWIDEGAIDCQ